MVANLVLNKGEKTYKTASTQAKGGITIMKYKMILKIYLYRLVKSTLFFSSSNREISIFSVNIQSHSHCSHAMFVPKSNLGSLHQREVTFCTEGTQAKSMKQNLFEKVSLFLSLPFISPPHIYTYKRKHAHFSVTSLTFSTSHFTCVMSELEDFPQPQTAALKHTGAWLAGRWKTSRSPDNYVGDVNSEPDCQELVVTCSPGTAMSKFHDGTACFLDDYPSVSWILFQPMGWDLEMIGWFFLTLNPTLTLIAPFYYEIVMMVQPKYLPQKDGCIPMWLLCDDAPVSCPQRDTIQTVSSSALLHTLCRSLSRILGGKRKYHYHHHHMDTCGSPQNRRF